MKQCNFLTIALILLPTLSEGSNECVAIINLFVNCLLKYDSKNHSASVLCVCVCLSIFTY
jgi:hypothetical protein